jgi:hypothetical protein
MESKKGNPTPIIPILVYIHRLAEARSIMQGPSHPTDLSFSSDRSVHFVTFARGIRGLRHT